MTAHTLRHYLRHGSDPSLKRRRGIVGLALAAASGMGLLTVYQMGLIRHLPEPPLPRFDTDKVIGSDEAYAHLCMPDAALGLLSYATTLGLAAAGGPSPERASARAYIPLLLAAKVGFDAWQAGRHTVHQWTRHKAFCIYCLGTAAATFATVPLVLPELIGALKALRTRSRR